MVDYGLYLDDKEIEKGMTKALMSFYFDCV